jgi:hypothetical protein
MHEEGAVVRGRDWVGVRGARRPAETAQRPALTGVTRITFCFCFLATHYHFLDYEQLTWPAFASMLHAWWFIHAMSLTN